MGSPFAASGPEQNVAVTLGTGDNSLLAGAAGFKWRVLSCFLISAGTVNLTMGSDVGGSFVAKSGIIPLVVNAQISLSLNDGGWFDTDSGKALNLKLSGAIAVTGVIKVQQIQG